jgi:hypothetical protein
MLSLLLLVVVVVVEMVVVLLLLLLLHSPRLCPTASTSQVASHSSGSYCKHARLRDNSTAGGWPCGVWRGVAVWL